MTKITKFDRATADRVARQVEEGLGKLAEELGVQITRGRGTFDQGSFSLTLQISTISETGEANTREADAFRREAQYYGLKAEHLFREITVHRGRMKIVGLKPRSQKFPILLRDLATGKQYKYPAETVKKALDA